MIRIDRIAVWLFVWLLAIMILSARVPVIKLSDEFCYMVLFVLGMLDCMVNNSWRRYKLMWTVAGIMAFYVFYSMLFCNYNTRLAVLSDGIVEMKQYVAFAAMLGVAPVLTIVDKKVLRVIAIVNVAICFVSSFGGTALIDIVTGHPVYLGATVFSSAMVYLYTCIKDDGSVDRMSICVVAVMLICGLVCTRSKYYGEAVLALFFIFVYRPGMLKHITVKHMAVVSAVLVLVVAVGWSKFDYYFISGNADATRFDPETMESYARPVLYFTGGLILIDHIPFGSGLASFASFPSSKPYSGLYHEYGIDKVYGLSEAMPDFICDAYYPLLAQFGVVGVMLFIAFFVYLCSLLRRLIRAGAVKYRYCFVVGSLIVCWVFIESIGGTLFAQPPGVLLMMLAGLICSKVWSLPANKPVDNENLNLKPEKRYL